MHIYRSRKRLHALLKTHNETNMKKLFLLSICCAFAAGAFAQNAVKDGSFEALNAGDQLPRIAAFTDFGGQTQTANPTLDEESVVQGVWYRKASNTGYLKAVVVDDDAHDGDKSLKLSVNKNSGQAKLDSWYSNTLVQYLALADNTEYTITFYAKAADEAKKLYVGLLGNDYAPLKGSKWIDLSNDWAEYTLKIKTKGKADNSGIIFGLAASYDDNDKTVASNVFIDHIAVTGAN